MMMFCISLQIQFNRLIGVRFGLNGLFNRSHLINAKFSQSVALQCGCLQYFLLILLCFFCKNSLNIGCVVY